MEGWARDPEGRPVLKLRVRAVASEGAANAAVIALVAKMLRLPRSAVQIAAGESSRVKRLEIEGADADAVAAAFGAP